MVLLVSGPGQERRDSNPQPPDLESGALPAELRSSMERSGPCETTVSTFKGTGRIRMPHRLSRSDLDDFVVALGDRQAIRMKCA